MGMPGMKDSCLNYEWTSLVERSDLTSLRNKQVKMVHGMTDKKVLLENTMMLSKRMVEENILFEQQLYASVGHNLQPVRKHHLKGVQRFYQDCWADKVEELSGQSAWVDLSAWIQ